MKPNPFILIITGIVILASCNSNETHYTSDNRVKVRTATVEEKSVTIPVHAVGKVYAKEEIKLAFKTGGIIREILVDEGQVVRKGQVLAVLNLSEIEAQFNQAELGFEKAERDYHRASRLYNDSVVTLEQLENAQTQLDYARATLEIAEFNFKYSRITAPENGKILKRLAEANELVGSGSPVFMFGSSEEDWVVRANITESAIFKLIENDEAKVKLDAYPDQTFHAIVTEIGTAADPYTGTYEIELTFDNSQIRLASGLFARFDIFPSANAVYDVIPINALVEANEKEGFVYKVQTTDEVIRQKVHIYSIGNEYLYAESDLKKGDKVVTDGASYINSNTKIQIIEDLSNELASK